MEDPRIVTHDALTFVGCRQAFIHALSPDANTGEVLGPLWGHFIPRAGGIANRVGEDMYGIIYGLPEAQRTHPDELQYIAGVLVSELGELPAGMVAWTVPAASFATFVHRGRIEKLADTVHGIYRQWLPSSPYQHSQLADIERYGSKFDPEGDDSEMEYWISIEPRPA
jgi:predicted transcriptional regulator YdeE